MQNDTVNFGGSAAGGGGMVVGYRKMTGISRRATRLRQGTEHARREISQTHRQRHAPFRMAEPFGTSNVRQQKKRLTQCQSFFWHRFCKTLSSF